MWLDMRLHGLEPESLRSTEKSLLIGHLARKRDLRFLEVLLVVKTIVAAANAIGGKDPGNGVQDLMKEYTNLLFPEKAHLLEDKVKMHAEIMETEFKRGPMKAVAREYEKKRKSRRK